MSDIDTGMSGLSSRKRVLSDSELDVVVGGIMIIGGAQERGLVTNWAGGEVIESSFRALAIA